MDAKTGIELTFFLTAAHWLSFESGSSSNDDEFIEFIRSYSHDDVILKCHYTMASKFMTPGYFRSGLKKHLEDARKLPQSSREAIVAKCDDYFFIIGEDSELAKRFIELLRLEIDPSTNSLDSYEELVAVLSERQLVWDIVYLSVQIMLKDGNITQDEISAITSCIESFVESEAERSELYIRTKDLIERLLQQNDSREVTTYLRKIRYYPPAVKDEILRQIRKIAIADGALPDEKIAFLDRIKNSIFQSTKAKDMLGMLVNAKSIPTALDLVNAIFASNTEEVQRILARTSALTNSSVDYGGNSRLTPIEAAIHAKNHSGQMIEMLAMKGADLNLTSDAFIPPIYRALMCGNLEAVVALKNLGVDVEKLDLYYRVSAPAGRERPDLIRFLWSIGVSAKSSEGLNFAILNLHKSEILEYLKTDIDLNMQTEKGMTCLILAVIKNEISIVKQLISAGADWTLIDKDGNDALAIAEDQGFIEIADYLRSIGDGANAQNRKSS